MQTTTDLLYSLYLDPIAHAFFSAPAKVYDFERHCSFGTVCLYLMMFDIRETEGYQPPELMIQNYMDWENNTIKKFIK